MIGINCISIENKVTDNMYKRSKRDWGVNTPAGYVNLPQNGDVQLYMRILEEHELFEN